MLTLDKNNKSMKQYKLGIIMNGVTGRMGTNQHLIRSILAIIEEGGIPITPNEVIMPDPILVGRNRTKLEKMCKSYGLSRFSTNLDGVLGMKEYPIYFDAQVTNQRCEGIKKAISAGKHIYCEKPISGTTAEALELYNLAEKAHVKHGVVQDKLWLPGILKLQKLINEGFFGKILSVKGEFGYWVFEGGDIKPQRPSWNYRNEDGGGIIVDMLCHWHYVLQNLFGNIQAVSCLGATHIDERVDESGNRYTCTADDACYATFEIENSIIAQFNSSWTTRVRRDDLLTIQVDGTNGSAVAGLRDCYIQSRGDTPIPVWNPDIEQPIDFYKNWEKVTEQNTYDNAFKVQWEMFLRHVHGLGDFKWDLLEGAKGIQLAELGIESWKTRRWIDIPELKNQ